MRLLIGGRGDANARRISTAICELLVKSIKEQSLTCKFNIYTFCHQCHNIFKRCGEACNNENWKDFFSTTEVNSNTVIMMCLNYRCFDISEKCYVIEGVNRSLNIIEFLQLKGCHVIMVNLIPEEWYMMNSTTLSNFKEEKTSAFSNIGGLWCADIPKLLISTHFDKTMYDIYIRGKSYEKYLEKVRSTKSLFIGSPNLPAIITDRLVVERIVDEELNGE